MNMSCSDRVSMDGSVGLCDRHGWTNGILQLFLLVHAKFQQVHL